MTPSQMQHAIHRELAADLTAILREPSYIYVDTIEPERDRLPVPRHLIEGMTEALQLADRKITSLENISIALAGALREILSLEPIRRFDVGQVLTLLDSVDETLK